MNFWRFLLCATVLVFFVSCGDNEENPTGPGTAPTASVLSASATSTNSINLSWTRCPDSDFSEYRLYRGESSGVTEDSVLVTTITDASDTLYTNINLEWNTTYYYALRTIDSENLDAWSNEVSAATPDSGSTSEYLTCYEIQGQFSSSPYEGQEVTVMGIVIVGGDEYYSSLSPYAVICDPGGGAWAALLLYGDNAGNLARGDSILVTGTVQEFYETTELKDLDEIQILGTGAEQPEPVDLSTAAANDEQWESVLVRVTDAVVLTALQYSYEIDDGSGSCYLGTLGDFTEPVVGDTLTAVGAMWYRSDEDEWRLQPRDDNDVDISGGSGPGDVLTCYEVQGQQENSPYLGQTVSVTGIITAGADDYTAVSGNTYAAMADAVGGSWSGLLLYGDDLAGLQRGDSVTVTGVVDEYYNMTEVKYPITYQVHSTGHALPEPEDFTTGELSPVLDLEQWESVFVRVSDVIVTQIGMQHYTWAVDDGSGECYAGTMGDFTYSPSVGDQIEEMTGLLWYSYDFKIQPRDDNDIVHR